MANIQLIKRLVIIFEVPTFVGEELCAKLITVYSFYLRLLSFIFSFGPNLSHGEKN